MSFSVENSISEEISEPQISVNFQIQEMKSVLTAKEKVIYKLKMTFVCIYF